jgi:hypothetical protein
MTRAEIISAIVSIIGPLFLWRPPRLLALKLRRQGSKLMLPMAMCNQPSIMSFIRTMVARHRAFD